MQGLDLKIEGGTSALTWVYNLLVSVFAELIKQYLTAALQDVIQENAGDLLDTLNGLMTPAIWPMLLRVCAVQLHELAPVTDKDVYSSIATEVRTLYITSLYCSFLVFGVLARICCMTWTTKTIADQVVCRTVRRFYAGGLATIAGECVFLVCS